jgi:large subunit ribosomal protein L7/L12
MKHLKKIMISAAMSAAMALVASPAFAEGATDAAVKAAAENVLVKTEEALGLVEKGADKADVLKTINEVRQSLKEFRYEMTERLRQKSTDRLRAAREGFESGDAKVGEAKLREALAGFKEMKEIYDANHK